MAFLQIGNPYFILTFTDPPVNKVEKDNKMLVLLRNRIKVFYRPESIIGRVDQVSTALTFSLRKQGTNLVLTGKPNWILCHNCQW